MGPLLSSPFLGVRLRPKHWSRSRFTSTGAWLFRSFILCHLQVFSVCIPLLLWLRWHCQGERNGEDCKRSLRRCFAVRCSARLDMASFNAVCQDSTSASSSTGQPSMDEPTRLGVWWLHKLRHWVHDAHAWGHMALLGNKLFIWRWDWTLCNPFKTANTWKHSLLDNHRKNTWFEPRPLWRVPAGRERTQSLPWFSTGGFGDPMSITLQCAQLFPVKLWMHWMTELKIHKSPCLIWSSWQVILIA